MSERIYAWLLRLYPSCFRAEYGEEALQLFRDRCRQERGFFAAMRLWLDLLADLAISVPRQYRHVQPAPIGASAGRRPDGTPSFCVLEGHSPRLGSLLLGAVLSAAAASIPIGHIANYRPFRSALAAHSPGYARWPPTSFRMTQAAGGSGQSGSRDFPSKPMVAQLASGFLQPPGAQPQSQEAPRAGARPAVERGNVGAPERQRVIHAIVANIKQHYVDPMVAEKMAAMLLAHETAGDYNAITDGAALAALLTRQLRDASQDPHLDVVYSQAPLHPPGLTSERLARYRVAMEQQNCAFEKVEVLPHNIGYLKLNSFPEPSICGAAATAAMASLNDADAIIFDLRDNRGGYPEMVMQIAAHLFDHPEYMYNPRENTTERSWTASPVAGARLADKPVYVLTSGRTFSGAEHFSYDLKMLKRATIVGERTGGAAHSGVFHRIDDHFGMGIPEARAINPFGKSDWEGTGVEPDVKVKAADALITAERLVQTKLKKK
ncbi:MAG: S41 family peptidase [Bryobacteraceae bacterium]